MFHPAMRDIYTKLICKDPISRHALRMTCRVLRKWIPVDIELVKKIKVLLGLRESQEFIQIILKMYSSPYLGVIPHQSISRVITQPKSPKRAKIPFTIERGYRCYYWMRNNIINTDELISKMFDGDVRIIIEKRIRWVISEEYVYFEK